MSYNNNLRRQSVRCLGGKEGQGLGTKPASRGTQDSTTLTGWCWTKWSGEGKMIALLVSEFANLQTEVFRHFPKTGIFQKFPLSSVREALYPCRYCTFCSIPEDISGIFRRFIP
jgi:hypothetical protein